MSCSIAATVAWRRLRRGQHRKVGTTAASPEPSATASPEALAAAFEAAAAGRRLADLRGRLKEFGVDALIVPTDDPHLSEIPPSCFARRAFISGFTGSAGTAVITASEARLWTDGRYFLQALKELCGDWLLMRSRIAGTPKIEDWLQANMKRGQVIGLDPSVHSAEFVLDLMTQLEGEGVRIRSLHTNPVDLVWDISRPELPAAPVRLHPESVAGKSASDKLAAVAAELEKQGADVLVVSALDEVAYLLNVRGGDVQRTPVVLSYLLVERTGAATLFVGVEKLPEAVRAELSRIGVVLRPYSEILASMEALSGSGKRVWLDPKRTNYALYVASGRRGPAIRKPSPIAMMKAMKNEAELEGMRAAHRRDGAALAGFLEQLEVRVNAGEGITEVEVDVEVTRARRSQHGYVDNSFDTIAGYGANGAIIHYRAVPETAATLGTGSLFLFDSGAQYLDGTTDITRTMHFGQATSRERECFTQVLKGHIALATAVVPKGTPGFVVDAFARRPLWASGRDYEHGTGHGVGAALGVHEGPQRISKEYDNTVALLPGMVVSNEPGFYVEGEFGIRIENLLVVVSADEQSQPGGTAFVRFEPLTLVPIQRELIDMELLDASEIGYLDAYHARVRAEVSPLLQGTSSEAALAWLHRTTAPLRQDEATES